MNIFASTEQAAPAAPEPTTEEKIELLRERLRDIDGRRSNLVRLISSEGGTIPRSVDQQLREMNQEWATTLAELAELKTAATRIAPVAGNFRSFEIGAGVAARR